LTTKAFERFDEIVSVEVVELLGRDGGIGLAFTVFRGGFCKCE
jgi:hypothetical protein